MHNEANLSLRNKIVRWSPLLIWMLVIFVVSNQPSYSIPQYGRWDLLVKKGGHFLAYALLAILARWAGFNARSSFILVLTFAASDELHQRHIAGRSGNLTDVFIDALGALSALLAMHLVPLQWRLSGWVRITDSDKPMPRDA